MGFDVRDKKQVITASILLIALVACFYFMFKKPKTQQGDTLSEVNVEYDVQSTYESKLAAYKAKNKRDHSTTRRYNFDLEETIESPSAGESLQIEIQPAAAEPTQRRTTHTSHNQVNKLRETIQGTSLEEKGSSEKSNPAPAANVPQSEKDRRREAMQAWNNTISSQDPDIKNTYKAVIHKTQTVSSGSMAVFRTSEEINTGSFIIPANTLVYGAVNVNQHRLQVKISSVTIKGNVYPVNITVYGTDGAEGIPLDVTKIQNEANRRASQEVARETRKRGGIVGAVLADVGNAASREKQVSCTLIDNQTIYFKFN